MKIELAEIHPELTQENPTALVDLCRYLSKYLISPFPDTSPCVNQHSGGLGLSAPRIRIIYVIFILEYRIGSVHCP
jgi:hypothetical protein